MMTKLIFLTTGITALFVVPEYIEGFDAMPPGVIALLVIVGIRWTLASARSPEEMREWLDTRPLPTITDGREQSPTPH